MKKKHPYQRGYRRQTLLTGESAGWSTGINIDGKIISGLLYHDGQLNSVAVKPFIENRMNTQEKLTELEQVITESIKEIATDLISASETFEEAVERLKNLEGETSLKVDVLHCIQNVALETKTHHL